ncbi:MAG: 5,10-methylenetetrahydrofolate reductase [Proteobacteria bacterium]|nr:5,10-methylenetetrahydrofolate reductase [Pseudomonadota bacterium]
MRLTEILKNREKPTISLEFFPARSEKAETKLAKVVDKLVALEPDFVSVTFGAGGSTREGSYNLVKKLKKEKNLEVLPYFACWGLGPDDIMSVVNGYRDLGIDSLLAVRGDRPEGQEDFKLHPQSLPHASDLLAFLGSSCDLCLGVAGYPEGHIESESPGKDLEYLKLKVESGAEFIIANYFWDNRYFFEFIERVRAIGIEVPVLPGVMPIFNVKIMRNLASLCGATITDELRVGIETLPEGDKGALLDFGVRFAAGQCRELIENGVPGLHIYTMDRSKSVIKIVESLRKDGLL